MSMIADTDTLAALCRRLAAEPFVAIDTEFMRDKTYYPKLCLVQLGGESETAAVDALAPGLSLAPLYELLADSAVVKVFHAARQDVEIFVNLAGQVPAPLFDTQIAAMVCGFGESVSYDKLVKQLTGVSLDKSSRLADWSYRPLTEQQLSYALADVTHLRGVYAKLQRKLERNNRAGWLAEEVAVLTDPETYSQVPEDSWRRLKVRSGKPRFLSVLRSLAAYREREAQRRDVPRARILRDDVLLDIAAHAPVTAKELARARTFNPQMAEGRLGQEILVAVAEGLAVPPDQSPVLPPDREINGQRGPVVDLLKVLLKLKSDEHGVANKLIASASDVEQIAGDDDADVPALKGWRRKIYGEAALALKHGKVALAANGERVQVIEV